MSSLDTGQNNQHTSVSQTPTDDLPSASDKPPSPQGFMPQGSMPQGSTPHIGHIPQSDSGICLTPQSQGSVSSPQQTLTVHQGDDVQENRSLGPQPPTSKVDDPTTPSQYLQHSSSPTSSPRHSDTSKHHHHSDSLRHHHPFRNVASGDTDSRSSTPDHFKGFQSPSPRLGKSDSNGSQSSDSFTCQAKYLVLQFLHHSTSEQHLLHLSHNSLSTTSESESRLKSHAQMLRQQWQDKRVWSSPTSPSPRMRARPLAKTKGSRSSPNLLTDAGFFQDVPQVRTATGRKFRRSQTSKAAKAKPGKSSPKLSLRQLSAQASLVRSVSENTDNSEHGTYDSDADDELDTSCDSNHQGSVTSLHFRSRLASLHEQMHKHRMTTLVSESESAAESVVNVAEEYTADPLEDEAASSILSLDMINVEQQLVSPATQYTRVNEYLVQMGETSAAAFQIDNSVFDATDTTLQNVDIGEDEVDSPPFHFTSHPDQAALESGLLGVPSSDRPEDGPVSSGFEPSQSPFFTDDLDDAALGACGGVEEEEAVRSQSRRGDRSRLKLDLPDPQESVLLVDAVLSLQQEIEEEMSSFESEFEEALHGLQSDYSAHSHGLSRSRSISPETAEAARILARIGDEVQQRHFAHLDRAVGRLVLASCAGLFTYENFREAALMVLDKDLSEWRQVATLLLYSQHVALHLAQAGHRGLHRVIDYTVRLLADTAADFIIRQGGWAAISALDQSSTSSSPDTTGPCLSMFLSMPEDTQAPQSAMLDETGPTDSTDLTLTGEEPGSQLVDREGEVIPSALSSGVEVVPPDSSAPAEEERATGEEEDGGGLTSTVGDAVIGSSLLTRCAVFAGVLAVTTAVTLSFIRS